MPLKKIYDTDTDSINDAAYICDTEMTILHVNRAFEELTGLKNDKVINKKCYYVFNNSEKTCKNICTSNIRKSEGNYFAYHDSQVLTPAKVVKDVRFLIFPRYENEKLAGYLVIIKEQDACAPSGSQDRQQNSKTTQVPAQPAPTANGAEKKATSGLTDKKLMIIANELLKENDALKKKLLGGREVEDRHPGSLDIISLNAPCGIFTVDQTRHITGWNIDAERISGYTAADVFGQKCDVFMQAQCTRKCLMFSDDKRSVHGEECIIKAKDGRLLTVLKSFEVMTGPDGKTTGAVEIFEDFTARKLSETQLNQLREMAEKSLRDKNFLVEKTAREMSLQLHTVTNFATMLEKSKLSERELDILAQIKTNCETLNELINILLGSSKK